MATGKKPFITQGEMRFLYAIVLGLIIGILIKKIKIGILLGVVLGIIVLFTSWLKIKRK